MELLPDNLVVNVQNSSKVKEQPVPYKLNAFSIYENCAERNEHEITFLSGAKRSKRCSPRSVKREQYL